MKKLNISLSGAKPTRLLVATSKVNRPSSPQVQKAKAVLDKAAKADHKDRLGSAQETLRDAKAAVDALTTQVSGLVAQSDKLKADYSAEADRLNAILEKKKAKYGTDSARVGTKIDKANARLQKAQDKLTAAQNAVDQIKAAKPV